MRTGLPVDVEKGICPLVAFQQLLPKNADGKSNIVKVTQAQGSVEVEPALLYNACFGEYCKLWDNENQTCVFVSILKCLRDK